MENPSVFDLNVANFHDGVNREMQRMIELLPTIAATQTRATSRAPDAASAAKSATRATREAFVAEFERDAKLRAEFGSVETYVAFKQAEAAGRFKFANAPVIRGRHASTP